MNFEFQPVFPVRPSVDTETVKRIDGLLDDIYHTSTDARPFILRCFKEPAFYHALPEKIRNDDQALRALMMNMGRFSSTIHVERAKRFGGDMSGLLGEKVCIAETQHADGRARRAEEGYRINVEYLRSQGIDPSKVLFFRITQPSSDPKPEWYWTSDYFETVKGLRQEIPQDQRNTAVILVADLETIHQNEGLMTDVNDDSGLAVRQIGNASFDQKLALAHINNVE